MAKKDIFVLLFAFVLFFPIFFINYRLTAFDTMPVDDYTSFVLKMDGKKPEVPHWSPYSYRWGYIASCWVSYKLLPIIPLSKMDGVDLNRLRALQGIAFTAYVFATLFFFTAYYYVRHRLQQTITHSMSVAFIAWFLSLMTQFTGADPCVLFFATLILIHQKHLPTYTVLMLSSFLINEKLPILFGAYYLMVMMIERNREYLVEFLLALVSLGLYFLERQYLAFPGYDSQTDLSSFGDYFLKSMQISLSFKGLYMNLLPLAILLAVGWWARTCGYVLLRTQSSSWVLLLLPCFFFLLGIQACHDFTIGRLTVFTLPFFIAPISYILSSHEEKLGDLPNAY